MTPHELFYEVEIAFQGREKQGSYYLTDYKEFLQIKMACTQARNHTNYDSK